METVKPDRPTGRVSVYVAKRPLDGALSIRFGRAHDLDTWPEAVRHRESWLTSAILIVRIRHLIADRRVDGGHMANPGLYAGKPCVIRRIRRRDADPGAQYLSGQQSLVALPQYEDGQPRTRRLGEAARAAAGTVGGT